MTLKEIIRDALGIAGLACVSTGFYVLWGAGVGLVALGASLVALAAVAR